MKRALLPTLNFLIAALLAVSSSVFAADAKQAAAPQKADPAKGEALYTSGDASRNIAACVACHGAAGNSTISQNPKLAGQHEAYLVKQLADFKGDGKTTPRSNPVMTGISKGLTDADMKNLSAYLAAQVQKPGAAKNKDSIELGKKIYRAGIAEKNVPACAACHNANGAGIPAQFPRIGGQHQDYTVAQLVAFRAAARKNLPAGTTARKNSPQMTTIASRLTDDEIEAVADYIAGLK